HGDVAGGLDRAAIGADARPQLEGGRRRVRAARRGARQRRGQRQPLALGPVRAAEAERGGDRSPARRPAARRPRPPRRSRKQPGMKLLAIVADHGSYLSTLKMTGPKAAVDAQKAAFLALAPTIRAGGAGALPGPGPANGEPEGAGAGVSEFEAKLPAGWSEL